MDLTSLLSLVKNSEHQAPLSTSWWGGGKVYFNKLRQSHQIPWPPSPPMVVSSEAQTPEIGSLGLFTLWFIACNLHTLWTVSYLPHLQTKTTPSLPNGGAIWCFSPPSITAYIWSGTWNCNSCQWLWKRQVHLQKDAALHMLLGYHHANMAVYSLAWFIPLDRTGFSI